MGHWRQFVPGTHLEPHELEGRDAVVTIGRIELHPMEWGEERGVMFFAGAKVESEATRTALQKKGWILNKTICLQIALTYGDDPVAWPGKVITLYPTSTQGPAGISPCIRVRTVPAEPQTPAANEPQTAGPKF